VSTRLLLDERRLNPVGPQLRAGTEGDAASIQALLESSGLPTDDLLSSNPRFVVACDNDRVVAAGALQSFGSSALLRSVAVAPKWRGAGLGRTIVRDLELTRRGRCVLTGPVIRQTPTGGLPDPVAVEGTEAQKRAAFRDTFHALENRIRLFMSLLSFHASQHRLSVGAKPTTRREIEL
jgi:GNAT superfamily N-acetyltransferase